MHIGQRVICCPVTLTPEIKTRPFNVIRPKPYTGKIVYIHPARRFVVVAFDGGKVRESFFVPDILQWKE